MNVTVWFSNPPVRLTGEVVKVIVPDEALRVKITSRGELPEYYDHIVGEEFDMWRLKSLSDVKYDDYFWLPAGQTPPG